MLSRGFVGWPRSFAVLVTFTIAAATAATDAMTGLPVGYALVYLLPVSLAAWRLRPWAVALTVGSAALAPMLEIVLGLNRHGWVELVVGAAVRVATLTIVVLLVRALHGSLERERRLALLDPLTGVANRRAFRAAADSEIERARRYGHPLSVLFADIDDFKAVNDSFGHDAGDEVLVAVAKSLSNSVRANDVVARVGGDEFVVLLPETGEAGAHQVASVVDRVTNRIGGQGRPISVSVGAVTFRYPPADVAELVRRSDDAMYAAKRAGKGRTTVGSRPIIGTCPKSRHLDATRAP